MPKPLSLLLVLAFHLLPLWPLAERRFGLAVATALLVALPYIKVQKLLAWERAIAAGQDGMGRTLADVRISLRRWRALTLRRELF